jgi:paraquat-inducible protein A
MAAASPRAGRSGPSDPAPSDPAPSDSAPPEIVCCPTCDALHAVGPVEDGARARCLRCGTVLDAGAPEAILRIVVLAATSLVLMTVVVFHPFLELRTGLFGSKASVFDTVMAFSQGIMAPLSLAVAAFVIVLPTARLALIVWALGPLSVDRTPWPGARRALRWAEAMRPWAMAEIFMVGVAIALVKLADLATLTMGPAFWAFGSIVVITALQDAQMTGHAIWARLEREAAR